MAAALGREGRMRQAQSVLAQAEPFVGQDPELMGTVALASLTLAGCLATTPQSGGQSATGATGSAGGATTTGASAQLESCPATLGTIRIDEQTGAPWYGMYNYWDRINRNGLEAFDASAAKMRTH